MDIYPGPVDPMLVERIRSIQMVVFDFDGVFTDNAVYVFEDGSEAVRCSRADGIGLRRLEAAGIRAMILSSETNPVVSVRSRKLGIACTQGCADKGPQLRQIAAGLGLALDQVAYVGNDINDLPCLAEVGLPVVVYDAHADVLPYGAYRTHAPGGYGAVREVCDLIIQVRSSVS